MVIDSIAYTAVTRITTSAVKKFVVETSTADISLTKDQQAINLAAAITAGGFSASLSITGIVVTLTSTTTPNSTSIVKPFITLN